MAPFFFAFSLNSLVFYFYRVGNCGNLTGKRRVVSHGLVYRQDQLGAGDFINHKNLVIGIAIIIDNIYDK